MSEDGDQEESEKSSENDDYDEYDEDYSNGENVKQGVSGSGSSGGSVGRSQDRDVLSEENSDFGVYICEARNQANDEGDSVLAFNLLNQNTVRRYIKLNPNGPPILRAVQSVTSHVSTDELANLMMKTSPAQIYSLNQVGKIRNSI